MSLAAAVRRLIVEKVDGVDLPVALVVPVLRDEQGEPIQDETGADILADVPAPVVRLRVYDAPPADAALPYASFGPVESIDDESDCIDAQRIVQQLDVWTADHGRQVVCVKLTEEVRRLLHRASGTLETGALAQMRVDQWRVMPDPDGVTAHGVLTVTADVEA